MGNKPIVPIVWDYDNYDNNNDNNKDNNKDNDKDVLNNNNINKTTKLNKKQYILMCIMISIKACINPSS